MEVPSLLVSCAGSTRASTAVLSQIEPTPGADIAAHAVPEDCGALPPLASFSDNSSEPVSVAGWRVTVMSAPILASHTGDSGCFTDNAAEPFALSFDDHDASPFAIVVGERAFDAGAHVSVEASTLSWLQSSSRPPISGSFMLTSAESAAVVSAAVPASSSTDTACAAAGKADIKPKPAANISSSVRSFRALEIITPPVRSDIDAETSAQNCGGEGFVGWAKARLRRAHHF